MTTDENLIKNELKLLQLTCYHITFRRKIYMTLNER